MRRELSIQLTPEQRIDRANKATKAMQVLAEFEEKYSIVKREHNAKIKEMKLDIKTFCRAFSDNAEIVEVECEQVYDLESKDTWSSYKGEEYDRRPMTESEVSQVKQGTIFNDGANLPGVVHSDPEDNHEDGELDDVFGVGEAPASGAPLEAVQ